MMEGVFFNDLSHIVADLTKKFSGFTLTHTHTLTLKAKKTLLFWLYIPGFVTTRKEGNLSRLLLKHAFFCHKDS